MTVKTANDIKAMEKVCQLAAQTLQYVAQFIKPGVTTNELDKIVHDYTLSHRAKPAPLNYRGFPKSICTSVNHCICHGVPDDTSATFFVGTVSEKAKKITDMAEKAMLRFFPKNP